MGFTEEADAITFRDSRSAASSSPSVSRPRAPRRRVSTLRAVYRILRPDRTD